MNHRLIYSSLGADARKLFLSSGRDFNTAIYDIGVLLHRQHDQGVITAEDLQKFFFCDIPGIIGANSKVRVLSREPLADEIFYARRFLDQKIFAVAIGRIAGSYYGAELRVYVDFQDIDDEDLLADFIWRTVDYICANGFFGGNIEPNDYPFVFRLFPPEECLWPNNRIREKTFVAPTRYNVMNVRIFNREAVIKESYYSNGFERVRDERYRRGIF